MNDINLSLKSATTRASDTFTFDEFMFEVEERRRRENNLVIFNLEDTNSRDNDIKPAKEVIHVLNPSINIPSETGCHRLGREYLPDKRRPLKITVASLDEIKAIMRNARKLKQFAGESKIFISRNLTPRELDAKNRVLSDFRARRDKGENVFLKYSFGIPKVMQKKLENYPTATINYYYQNGEV
ncbi:hypothetical protein QE152_g19205 [Popillia japonica]|uniref:Uncharacterized protein n=1 Tax=Popillia japonica TaxID=7064 RepID=A0AAW1KV83_POPJA